MLRKNYLFVAILAMLFSTFTSKAQVYEKGNVIFDAYYGGPNLFSSVLRTAYNNSSEYAGVKFSTIGPLGGKAEYVFSKRIGVGINVNYANTSVSAKYEDSDGEGNVTTYDYKASMPRLRIFPTINIHLGNNDKLDPYFSFGAGYSSFKMKVDTDAPNAENVSFTMPGTFAIRGEFGLRYFFTDNIGAHLQFGIGGGPLFAGGLSFKF